MPEIFKVSFSMLNTHLVFPTRTHKFHKLLNIENQYKNMIKIFDTQIQFTIKFGDAN